MVSSSLLFCTLRAQTQPTQLDVGAAVGWHEAANTKKRPFKCTFLCASVWGRGTRLRQFCAAWAPGLQLSLPPCLHSNRHFLMLVQIRHRLAPAFPPKSHQRYSPSWAKIHGGDCSWSHWLIHVSRWSHFIMPSPTKAIQTSLYFHVACCLRFTGSSCLGPVLWLICIQTGCLSRRPHPAASLYGPTLKQSDGVDICGVLHTVSLHSGGIDTLRLLLTDYWHFSFTLLSLFPQGWLNSMLWAESDASTGGSEVEVGHQSPATRCVWEVIQLRYFTGAPDLHLSRTHALQRYLALSRGRGVCRYFI